MRKFFTFMAAMCCAMFFSVPSVMAADPEDGAKITVAGTSVTAANCEDVKGDGKVSYDASSHTLTLNGVNLSGSISIDASSNKIEDPVTIKVIGTCKVTHNAVAIYMSKSYNSNGLVIEGDSEASLEVITTATANSAILCGPDQGSGFSYCFPLVLQGGMMLQASSTSSSKEAVMAKTYKIDNSNFEITAKSGVNAIKTWSTPTLEKVSVIKKSVAEMKGYAYNKAYGIIVNGVQMCDGFPKDADGSYYLNNSTLPSISSGGALYYYPESKELVLENFAIASAESGATGTLAALVLNESGVVMKAKGNGASIDGSSSLNHKGLIVNAEATIDLNGQDIVISSNKSNYEALNVSANLTIKNSGDPSKELTVNGKQAKGLYGDGTAKVTINSALVTVKGNGTAASFSNVGGLELSKDIMLGTDLEWDKSQKAVCKSGSPATDKVTTEYKPKFDVRISPAAGGSVAVTDGTNPVELPNFHSTNTNYEVTATANAGYKFGGLRVLGSAKMVKTESPATISVGGTESATYEACFSPTIESNSPWFVVADNKLYQCADKFQGNLKLKDEMPVTGINFVMYSVYSDGVIYFVETNFSNNAIYSVNLDVANSEISGSKQTILDMQATYEFANLAYSDNDDCLYSIATKASKKYLVKIDMSGNIEELEEVTTKVKSVNAMAADDEGNLYIYDYPNLTKYNIATKTITVVGNLGLSSGFPYTAMAFDPYDDALYMTAGTSDITDFYSVNTSTGAAEWLWQVAKTYTFGLFTTAKSTVTKYKVTASVKAGQEAMGSVSPTSTKKKADETFELKATANPGYVFDKWDDGNTDNPRTITVTADGKKNYVASFKDDPNLYPIWVAGVQLGKTRSVLAAGDPAEITAGSVVYDDANKTITFNGLKIATTGDKEAFKISASAAASEYTIIISGDCQLQSAAAAMSLKNIIRMNINCKGSDKLIIKSTVAEAIKLESADLTIYGMEMSVSGATYGILGTGAEALQVTGSKLDVTGTANGSIVKLSKLNLKGCSMASGYEFANKQVEKSGAVAKDKIQFTPDNLVSVVPFEDGTGLFNIYKVDGDGKQTTPSYENTTKGWFKAEDKVMIVAKPASGFAFSHWSDNMPGYKDPGTFVGANDRDPKKVNSGINLTAYFYYKPKSKATWCGVNNGKFVSFKMTDYAAEVRKATAPNAGNVKAGDFVRNKWMYLDNTDFKYIESFTKVIDGEDLKDPKTAGSISEAFTDMAYDIIGNKIYGVKATKLYSVDESDGKVEELAELQYKEAAQKVAAIAVDANRNIYLLSEDASHNAVLYTTTINKIKDGKLPLNVVGEEAKLGALGTPIDISKQQSMAFDHATGELFWGNKDYIRYISTRDLRTYVAGDLGQKDGSQDYIKSLHNTAKPIYIKVLVADDQDDWGTVSVEGEPKEKKTITNVNFTITATANAGYHFAYWEIKGRSKEIEESTYTSAETEDMTYIAHFEEGEGIESVTLDVQTGIQKVMMNGVIYIIRDGRMYNVTGALVR